MKKLIALTLVLVFIIGCGQSSNYGSSSTGLPVDTSTEIGQDVSNVDSADVDLEEPNLDFNLDDW